MKSRGLFMSQKSPGLFLLLKTTFLDPRWFQIPGCPGAPSLDRAASRCSAAATRALRATAASSTLSASVGKRRRQSHGVGKKHQVAERGKRVKDITLNVNLVNKNIKYNQGPLNCFGHYETSNCGNSLIQFYLL